MKTPPLDTPTPEPVYGCAFECCRTETSNPADRIYWSDRLQGWYCDDCFGDSDDLHGDDLGIQLSLFLSRREFNCRTDNPQPDEVDA